MPGGVDERLQVSPDQMELPFGPAPKRGVSFLRHGARRFAEKRGREYSSVGLDQVQAQSQFQTRVAKRYESTQFYAGDKRMERSYDALKNEVHQQFDYLTAPRHKGGLGVKVQFEPELEGKTIYPTHQHMIEDLHQNRRLRVNKTGSSPEDQAVGHPYLDDETNDKFRAVHDAFGHAAIGRSFSRHGEEAAYISHAQMFSPQARPALMSETRAQNSALNYGSNPGAFPEQKATMMPDWMVNRRIPR